MLVTVIVPEFVLGQVRRKVHPVDAVAEQVYPLGVAPIAPEPVDETSRLANSA